MVSLDSQPLCCLTPWVNLDSWFELFYCLISWHTHACTRKTKITVWLAHDCKLWLIRLKCSSLECRRLFRVKRSILKLSFVSLDQFIFLVIVIFSNYLLSNLWFIYSTQFQQWAFTNAEMADESGIYLEAEMSVNNNNNNNILTNSSSTAISVHPGTSSPRRLCQIASIPYRLPDCNRVKSITTINHTHFYASSNLLLTDK